METVKKVEKFLDELTELAKHDPERVVSILRGLAGIFIMADMMKSEMQVEIPLEDKDLKENVMSKIAHLFRDEDELPN